MSKTGFVVAAIVLAASPACAHVGLETKQATIGASYKAVFTVAHGCAGSPTVKIRVQIPEGLIAAKPMPQASWNGAASSGQNPGELVLQCRGDRRKIGRRIRLPRQQAVRRRQGGGVERRQAAVPSL